MQSVFDRYEDWGHIFYSLNVTFSNVLLIMIKFKNITSQIMLLSTYCTMFHRITFTLSQNGFQMMLVQQR